MKRLIKLLKRYVLSEEYIRSYTFNASESKDTLDFYFQTINSKEDEFHHMTLTDIPKRVSSNDIGRVIKALYNKVRELEKRGE